ncbi:RDD family protein [Chengkuizengella sp. SCS-71B]|uniref:RDD family protein n=1 Tax=Chengkuizengella sp. SCS-71B TaxID=3115290 RepID=UPI0032C2423D
MTTIYEKSTTQEFTIPEYELASLSSRLLAKIIDTILLVIVIFISVMLPNYIIKEREDLTLIFFVGIVLTFVFYQAYLLTRYGYSIGKKVLKIKIVHNENNNNGGFFRNVFLRSFINELIASIIPLYGLIDILFIFTNDHRCLHDRLAGTKVIIDDESISDQEELAFDELWNQKQFNNNKELK